MPKREIEGDFIQGWPGRKRLEHVASTDAEGRVIGARMPFLDLEGLITPTDASYVIAQLAMPEAIHPDDFSLSIGGLIDRPCELTIEDLRKLPGRTVRAVIECAGNDDMFFDYLEKGSNGPKPSLRPDPNERNWRDLTHAAMASADADDLLGRVPTTCFVSSGEWTGVPLAEVLRHVGVSPKARAVFAQGRDDGRPDPTILQRSARNANMQVFDPGVINFEKALPMAKALDPDTLLAWAHNGEYLRHVHGAPLRMVVPGWSGNWWVKWLQKIDLVEQVPELYYQDHYFVHGRSPDDPERRMVTALGVKSVIVEPRDEDSPLAPGSHAIRGLAWSGEGKVTRVEVSVDGGASWRDAHVEKAWDKWLWVRWSMLWDVDRPGSYRLMARATDERGRTQPQIGWNFQRKHFDGIVPVDVTIV